jgi:hypothetical protein
MSVPELHITLVTTPVNPKLRLCPICGKDTGARLLAGRIPPKWVKNGWRYKLWSSWTWYIRRLPLGISCHEECLPPGFKFWTVEQAQDLVVYHSKDAEKELTDMLIAEINATRND